MTKKAEIVQLVSLLMSSLPCRLPSGVDLKLALEGYAIALEDCNISDLKSAVTRCIKGVPDKLQWAPSAPELAQLVRDAKARRDNSGMLEAPPKAEAKYSAFEPISSERRTKLAEYARKVAVQIGQPQSPEDWQATRLADGTIKPYTG